MNLLLISLLGHLSTGNQLKKCCALTGKKKWTKWGLDKDRASYPSTSHEDIRGTMRYSSTLS
jgi:hypothetical protein